MSTDAQKKHALYLAGKMAEIAGRITGEGISFRVPACHVFDLSKNLEELKEATMQYNLHMVEMSRDQ